MELTENAKVVMERRIAARDENGDPLESAEDIFVRVAHHVAKADLKYGATQEQYGKTADQFYEIMSNLDFLPNSPTLVNAGRPLGQLSACFVLPVEDSIDGIFQSISNAAKIHKTGGGTGFSFSRLRADGSFVKETSGVASGPVSFMRVFDSATAAIKQGGTRRGANMGILRVDHPDIRKFIHLKDDLSEMTNFNISVAITDEFMDKLVNGDVEALLLFDEIIDSAHKTGDPGVVFIDRINAGKANPVPERGPIEATNPCGEQPLYPYDSCNLGSINLSNFVKDGKVDYARLDDIVGHSVHFLDNVIDMNKYPLPEIEEISLAIRRIGLGVMGWADMLIKMGIPYNSAEAIELAESVMSHIQQSADKASIMLGMKRGNFPDFEKSIYKGQAAWPYLRNSTRTTIAPTGTIGIIAGASGGIEPIFAFEFTRSHYLDKNDPNKRTELKEVYGGYKPHDPVYVSSGEIDPGWHVKMQAAFQKYTDNAVSKTINLPNSATIDDVAVAYIHAWEAGCNGITVYRDGCRENQVLSVQNSQPREEEREDIYQGDERRIQQASQSILNRSKLPVERNSITKRFTVGDFEGYITVGCYDDGRPGEVFIIGNKVGSSTRGYLDTIGSLISYTLQAGYSVNDLAEKFSGTRFEPSGLTGDSKIPVATSIVDYVFRYLKGRFGSENSTEILQSTSKSASGNMCPECDGVMYYGEGCESCISCGYSKCG